MQTQNPQTLTTLSEEDHKMIPKRFKHIFEIFSFLIMGDGLQMVDNGLQMKADARESMDEGR